MKKRHVRGGSLLLVGALLTGCELAASETALDPVKTACGSNDVCMRELMVHYDALATDLMRTAGEYAREADYQALQLGQDSPKVRARRVLAQKAWMEALEAAFLARQYESQLPPKTEMTRM